MKTLRQVLEYADPLGHEPGWTAGERRAVRRTLVHAPRAVERPRRLMFAVVPIAAVALIAVVATRVPFWWGALEAAIRFEVRLAEENPASGLREATVAAGRTIYLHDDIVVTNDDIVRAQVIPGDSATAFGVAVSFSPEGARKMMRATADHSGRPMAILIDGQVVAASTVRGSIGASAVVNGSFTRAEAERIVEGIRGR